MAYSRYIPEIKDKDGNIYGVMDKEARASLDRKYEKPSAGIPAEDIASGVIPDVPAWAKAAQKPSYTAAEVGATTTQEVNNLIASAIGDIHSFDLEIVQELPTTNIKTHTIYLLPKTGEANDAYDEYAYINNSWEMIGNTQIDLSGYALKSELPSVPVQDVQVNGTSILQNGIADVPAIAVNQYGVAKIGYSSESGLEISSTGNLRISHASASNIKTAFNSVQPITPDIQHNSVFYGLAKAAGDTTQAQSDNAVGTYTDEAKTAIQTMLDVPANDDVLIKTPTFGTPEVLVDTTTLSFHKDGDFDWYCTDENPIQEFTKNSFDYNSIYKIEWDGNEYEELAVEYEHPVKNDGQWHEWTAIGNVSFLGNSTAYQSTAPFAVAYDYHRNSSEIQIFTTETSATHTVKITKIPFIKNVQREQFYTNSFKNHSIIRPGTGKNSAVVISAADASGEDSFAEGAATIASGYGSHAEGALTVASGTYSHSEGSYTSASGIISHAEGTGTIAGGAYSHAEGFQTKATGWASHAEGARTEARSTASSAEGFYTVATAEESHVAGMFNILDSYEIFQEWTANTEYHAGDKVKITTQSNDTATVSGYECLVDNNDAQFTVSNWTKLSDSRLNYGYIFGNGKNNDSRSNAYALSWTGDGKYAGHVYVGANADSSGGTMLPEDVQIDGTSIVQNGVANVPIATANTAGVVKVDSGFGISIDSTSKKLFVDDATETNIKVGTEPYKPIVPRVQHFATFYGLAKAAGADMASSSNEVGTYTDEAKQAIQTMLGIDLSSIASQVEIPLVETVSGAAVTITGQPNTRYMCGEVTSISITPPAAGSIDVVFTSGSTVAVLTLPSTVKMPEWFDASTLDTNTVYEILITDGVYGSVMTWAT